MDEKTERERNETVLLIQIVLAAIPETFLCGFGLPISVNNCRFSNVNDLQNIHTAKVGGQDLYYSWRVSPKVSRQFNIQIFILHVQDSV